MNYYVCGYFLYLAFAVAGYRAQGILDLSLPTYAIEYQNYHIDVFQTSTGNSDPTFYYTPSCALLSNGTTFAAKNAHPGYFVINIGLWDEDYTRHIRSYLTERTGIRNPNIRVVPFKWMRIDAIENFPVNHVEPKWKSIVKHPTAVAFHIRCLVPGFCDKMEESFVADSAHFSSNVRLAFAHRQPNTTKHTLNVHRGHLHASHTFQTINDRYPDAKYVFLQKFDFNDLVRETLWESLEHSLSSEDFVHDEQIEKMITQLSRKLRHNTTSTSEFTEEMWNVTFWNDNSQRPDVIAKNFDALFSSGKPWLRKIMRGENVTSETGIPQSSTSVARAISDLKAGKGHVRWSIDDIIIEPFTLYCIALGTLREQSSLVTLSVWLTKRTADYVSPAYMRSTADVENKSDTLNGALRHFNHTLEDRVLMRATNMTDHMPLQTHCRTFEPKGNATWLMRDADTLWSLNHTLVTAYLRTGDGTPVCQQFTATTNSFGEFTLSLPKANGLGLCMTFEVTGYYPIMLHNVALAGSQDALNAQMEPLLFIPRRLPHSGTTTGTFYDVSAASSWLAPELAGVTLTFRSGMHNYDGTVLSTVTTSADGVWNITLPAGHYTVTASKSGYITLPFTVAVVGGKMEKEHKGLCRILNDDEIRIVATTRREVHNMLCCINARGPVEGSVDRAHSSITTANGLVRHDIWMNPGIASLAIAKQLAGIYRISISDYYLIYNSRSTGTLWDMASLCSPVQLYKGNKLWAEYFAPNRMGNAWSMVEIDGSNLKLINEMNTVTKLADVN